MDNVWFQANKMTLETIKRFLVEESYKGDTAPSALSPMVINNTLDGAILEIRRLQIEVDTLKAEISKLTPKKEETPAKQKHGKQN